MATIQKTQASAPARRLGGSPHYNKDLRKMAVAGSVTLFTIIIALAFLMPFAYGGLTAFKDQEQITRSAKGSILPMDVVTVNYRHNYVFEGERSDIYIVQTVVGITRETNEWALINTDEESKQLTFVDPVQAARSDPGAELPAGTFELNFLDPINPAERFAVTPVGSDDIHALPEDTPTLVKYDENRYIIRDGVLIQIYETKGIHQLAEGSLTEAPRQKNGYLLSEGMLTLVDDSELIYALDYVDEADVLLDEDDAAMLVSDGENLYLLNEGELSVGENGYQLSDGELTLINERKDTFTPQEDTFVLDNDGETFYILQDDDHTYVLKGNVLTNINNAENLYQLQGGDRPVPVRIQQFKENLDIYFVPMEDGTKVEMAHLETVTERTREGRVTYNLFLDPDNLYSEPYRWDGALQTIKNRLEFAPRTGNFAEVWEKAGFPRLFRNTLAIAVVGLIGTLLSSICVAYAFARFPIPGKNYIFLILIGTIVLPNQVRLVPTYAFFSSIEWTGTWLPLTVPHFFANAYNVFLLRQYFLTLPREMDEAAMIDGAGPFTILVRVIVPQSWPVIVSVALFHFVFAWNDYFEPLIYLLGKPDLVPISVGIQQFNFIYDQKPHLIQATSLLALVVPIIVFVLTQRFFLRGVVFTGVDK